MYLLLVPERKGIRYSATIGDADPVYEEFCPIGQWTAREVSRSFQTSIAAKLRSHGKVFSHIGIVVPYAPSEYTAPIPASSRFLPDIARKSALLTTVLQPAQLTLCSSMQVWPHLKHMFLFDTFFSSQISRDMALPAVNYDLFKELDFKATVLHSYGHRANLFHYKGAQPLISLYIGDRISVVSFESGKIIDATVSYSPFSPLVGPYDFGSVDPGLFLRLAERKRLPELLDFFSSASGILPMVEHDYSLDELIAISGIGGRKKNDSHNIPIESMEWIELSVRNFIRSLRGAIAALLANDDRIKIMLINTSVIPESSDLWPLLTTGWLGKLQTKSCPTSLAAAAGTDLASMDTQQ